MTAAAASCAPTTPASRRASTTRARPARPRGVSSRPPTTTARLARTPSRSSSASAAPSPSSSGVHSLGSRQRNDPSVAGRSTSSSNSPSSSSSSQPSSTPAALQASTARNALASSSSDGPRRTPQQRLTFRPLPHGHLSLRPGPAITLLLAASPSGRYQAHQTQTHPATNDPRKHWKSHIYMRQATNNGQWLKLPYPILSTAMTAGFLRYGYTYQFKVTAMNLTGESAASDTATVLIVPAWAARRCASVTSNWLLNNLGGTSAIQLYDVTGTVCATRYGNNFKVEQSWNTHGKQLYDGIFWFIVTDCNTNVAVWSRAMAYDNGTPNTSGSALSYAPIDPADLYSIRVTGSGDVEGINMINSKFSSRPPRGIIPFTAQTPC